MCNNAYLGYTAEVEVYPWLVRLSDVVECGVMSHRDFEELFSDIAADGEAYVSLDDGKTWGIASGGVGSPWKYALPLAAVEAWVEEQKETAPHNDIARAIHHSGACMPECPHGVIGVSGLVRRVGSGGCVDCQHHVSITETHVTCSHPVDDEPDPLDQFERLPYRDGCFYDGDVGYTEMALRSGGFAGRLVGFRYVIEPPVVVYLQPRDMVCNEPQLYREIRTNRVSSRVDTASILSGKWVEIRPVEALLRREG